jgi:outer membrane receptor protein involved in Fe transport
MRNILYIILIITLFYGQSFAQAKIQGKVLEKADVPASFATVALLSAKDSSIIKGRVAEDNGTYIFEKVPFGKYKISITHTGFKKKFSDEFQLSDSNMEVLMPELSLQEDSKVLSEVVVKAQKSLIEQAGDRMIVNVENSILSTGNTGLEVLKSLPGVRTDAGGALSLRGKSNVMVMIDGKIISKEVAPTLLENLQGDNIVKVELITNPSAKYDAQASGGILNIITRKGLAQGLNGRFRFGASQGRHGRVNAGVDFNYRKESLNLYGGYDYRYSERFREESDLTDYRQSTIGEQRKSQNNSFSTSGMNAIKLGLDYNINKNHTLDLLAEGSFVNYDGRIDGEMSFQRNNTIIDSTLTSRGIPSGDIRLMNYSASYKGILDSSGKEISVTASYIDYMGNRGQSFSSQTYTPERKAIGSLYQFRNYTPSSIKVFTAQADYSHPIDKTSKIEFGARLSNTKSDNKNLQELFLENVWKGIGNSQTNYLENVLAGYISYSKEFGSIKSQIGLRAEQSNINLKSFVDTTYLNFFPSISLEKKFSDDYSLNFSFSRKIDRPAYDDMIPFTVVYDKYTANRGNSRLKPQYSNVFELSASLKSWIIALNHTQINNPITEFADINYKTRTMTTTIINFNDRNSTSLNITLPISITSWWQSNNNILGIYNTLLLKNYLGTDYNRNWFAGNISTMNTFSIGKGLSAELIAYYQSSQTDGLYNISATGSVDLGLKKTFADKKATIQLGLKDIFLTQPYYIGIDYSTIKTYGYNKSDTRRISINFTYKFGKKTVKGSNEMDKKNDGEAGRLKF